MTAEQQKEQFSEAYVRAVAAAARVNIYEPKVDVDSVDIGFSVKSIADRPLPSKLDAQLKCVTKLTDAGANWRYSLKVKNYNELVGEHYVPRILVVVLVPVLPRDWLAQTVDRLCLHRCGYWVSLAPLRQSANAQSVTVSLPKAQIFTPHSLNGLLSSPGAS